MIPLRNCAILAAIYLYCNSTVALGQVLGSLASVEVVFKDAKVIPDAISIFNPTALLSAVYVDPSTQTGIIFEPGAELMTNRKYFQLEAG